MSKITLTNEQIGGVECEEGRLIVHTESGRLVAAYILCDNGRNEIILAKEKQ